MNRWRCFEVGIASHSALARTKKLSKLSSQTTSKKISQNQNQTVVVLLGPQPQIICVDVLFLCCTTLTGEDTSQSLIFNLYFRVYKPHLPLPIYYLTTQLLERIIYTCKYMQGKLFQYLNIELCLAKGSTQSSMAVVGECRFSHWRQFHAKYIL